MGMFDLKKIREDIDEKEENYNVFALESYFQYMTRHCGKMANKLYEDYMDLIKEESKTTDNQYSNFLAIKEIISEYELALAARKSYVYALMRAQEKIKSKDKAEKKKLMLERRLRRVENKDVEEH